MPTLFSWNWAKMPRSNYPASKTYLSKTTLSLSIFAHLACEGFYSFTLNVFSRSLIPTRATIYFVSIHYFAYSWHSRLKTAVKNIWWCWSWIEVWPTSQFLPVSSTAKDDMTSSRVNNSKKPVDKRVYDVRKTLAFVVT